MIEQQYGTSAFTDSDHLPNHLDLSESSTTGTSPCSSGYSDFLPCNNTTTCCHIGSQCDCLLSPVSNVASPPLQHIVKQYATAPDLPLLQQPSPPNSAKMYQHNWSTTFNLSVDEAAVHPEYYLHAGRTTPGPPDPYLGHFTVSEGSGMPVLNHGVATPYFIDMAQMAHHDTLLMRGSPSISIDSGPHDVEPSLPTPTLSSNGQIDSHDERDTTPDTAQRNTVPSHRVPNQGVTKSKKKPALSSKKPSSLRIEAPTDEEVGEHSNCNGDEVPPQITKDCPDEERFLFEARWENRHNKGQMWEKIQKDYINKFQRTEGKEALQMKYKRGRSRYLAWLPRDEEILREAWQRMEKDRYKTLLALFHESGGSRNMFLSPSDIEYKVATDLGLEEELYINGFKDLGLRRRCRYWKPKKHGLSLDDMKVQPHFEEESVLNQIHGRATTDSISRVDSAGFPRGRVEDADIPMSDSPPVAKTEPAESSVAKARKQRKPSEKPRKGLPKKSSRRPN